MWWLWYTSYCISTVKKVFNAFYTLNTIFYWSECDKISRCIIFMVRHFLGMKILTFMASLYKLIIMSASIQLAQISLFVFGWFWFKINFREKIWKGLFYLQWKEQQARSEFHLYVIRNAFSQTHRRMGEWLLSSQSVLLHFFLTHQHFRCMALFICKPFLAHYHHLCGIYKDRHHRCNNISSIPCCGTLWQS